MSYVAVNAGELNRLVTVNSLLSSQDTFGQQIDTLNAIKQVYAKIRSLFGAEQIHGNQVNGILTHEIETHYDSVFDELSGSATPGGAKSVITFGARRFYVDNVHDVDDQKRKMLWQVMEVRN